MNRFLYFWLAVGVAAATLMPWYAVEGGLFSLPWLDQTIPPQTYAPALHQVLLYGRWWLAPAMAILGLCAVTAFAPLQGPNQGKLLIAFAAAGIVAIAFQGFAIGNTGPRLFADVLAGTAAEHGQAGLGLGGFLVAITFLFTLTTGVSRLGEGRGDAFIVGLIGAIMALVATFVFFPIGHILLRAFELPGGGYGIWHFANRLFSSDIWGVSCFTLTGYCGPAWNSLFLAALTGAGTATLGLMFALVATRTEFRAKRILRVLTVLPIITPPFVIGLALILLFGRAGAASELAYNLFGVEKTRWLYGFPGIFMAQMLSFTPIAFLVMIGVVEGVSPSMEEASQTMHAGRWQTFLHVSLPLMRPGIANAFLLGFIESLADFGNPLVLGGNYNVLSTEIYFAIVGAVTDPARAAILAFVLLSLTLSAFLAQRIWLGRKSYSTVSGKGDSGLHCALSPALKWTCYLVVLPWAAFTAVVYGMIGYGSFVRLWGYDNTFTLAHYIRAFGVHLGAGGWVWTGSAWDSYFTTLEIASLAAPLTATVGLATAYLLVRQKFFGKNAFEFSTMLSFAIPGTVVGVSYIMAFNVPPIELTGTGLILVIAFVFRNMPVGVRGGIAAMSQLDKSLDEASLTLGANSATTVRRVILPLLGPAIMAALTYSFVRAITSVSAVIFLVSARHNMATSFIVGRVENGEFGIAIAYAVVLIATMLAAILLLQLVIGKRRLRRERQAEDRPPAGEELIANA